ncbi:vWA domain-containing protein [Oceanobacillus chungangensis]|uniref:VWA domain-containing protein n=1 Tax=Oceanobacillus chungangensis TaxID=1229152 RepID=A0A3D8PMA8_9BACI|nr:VWA domain-containing protein [Oceanobacillus chungangensis]RDW17256.1 VWA domain-containing protein [Oceanobacillus chungangensis]
MYRFHDNSRVDTNIFLQLQDLSTVLSGDPEINFEYNFGSFIDVINHKVTASRFWDTANETAKEAGHKSDVYLRTIGTLHYSNVQMMQQYLGTIDEAGIPKFAAQLFTLLEDIRLEEKIKQERPGTTRLFTIRRDFLKHYFETQLDTNVTRSFATDELFCLIYLLLQSNSPDPYFPRANDRQLDQLERIKALLYTLFEAKSTSDITNICEQIVFLVSREYDDSINEYFIFPVAHIEQFKRNTLFDELIRKDDLVNDEEEEVDDDQGEAIDEKFSTWHRENKNGESNQTFLQFELDQGTKTSLLGDGAREAQDADQAMAQIQGTSGESKQNDYSKLESLAKKDTSQGNQSESKYGEENNDAVKIIKDTETPTYEDEKMYQTYVQEIEAYKRKLANTIEKTLEHKRNAPRKDLVFGRLSKKLLPIVIDENPRIFYKKNQESKEIDAVFTLLVDCSASMHGKMAETKKGIILFHEVLNYLKIPHSIIGFWEDANDVKEGYQPNYFHIVNAYTDSFYQNNGSRIMQLEPQEDNRDGFSIRVITEDLVARREKHKFLLVFSDGEPAAANYDQNGIIDTHLAVSEARKKNIDVVGMFLADGEVKEREDMTMKNIYGKERLMIPSVSELPEHFAPLLKKLLLKSI